MINWNKWHKDLEEHLEFHGDCPDKRARFCRFCFQDLDLYDAWIGYILIQSGDNRPAIVIKHEETLLKYTL